MKVKKLYKDSKLPVRANPTDSGMDVFAHHIGVPYETHWVKKLKPNEAVFVSVGIAVSVETGFEVQVRPRSGLALKQGLTIVNSPGTIDSSYRGEVSIILLNTSNREQTIEKDMKIAQLVVAPVVLCDIEEVNELDYTSRGKAGFGSTGK